MVLIGDDLWKAKIAAFLHDPPEKAAVLFHASHERVAEELRTAIGLSEDDFARFHALVETADHLASGADRLPTPKDDGIRVDFLTRPRIKHPLSAQEYDLGSLQSHDWRQVTEAALRVAGELAARYADPHRAISSWQRRYLALWRELGPALAKDGTAGAIGSLWAHLPADTRVPDHSIWDHLRLASALAGALGDSEGQPTSEAALLLFTLGPVQSFIAAARKTQDLWAGSWILSWLAWSAMRPVVVRLGPDAIVFPDLREQPLVDLWLGRDAGLDMVVELPRASDLAQASLPNRFLAIVPPSLAESLALEVESSARDALARLGEESLREALGDTPPSKGSLALSAAQLREYLEVRWVALEWPSDRAAACGVIREAYGASPGVQPTRALALDEKVGKLPGTFFRFLRSGHLYGDLYGVTERALAAVKRAQPFAPASVPPGPRCAQTGELAPVVQGPWRHEQGADKTIPVTRHLAEGEMLSAVVLVKRELRRVLPRILGLDPGEWSRLHFPSTGSIAAAPYLEALAEMPNVARDLAEALDRHPHVQDRGQSVPAKTHRKLEQAGLRAIGYLDARVLFSDDGLDEFVDEDGEPLPDAVRLAADGLLKNRTGPGRPSPYYALVLADGDSMGAWLSGERAPRLEDVYHSDVWTTMKGDARAVLAGEIRPLSPAYHGAISSALRVFSRELIPRLTENVASGKLIYSGGDDVLALLPLRDLPDVLRFLPLVFSGAETGERDGMRVPFELRGGFVKLDGRPLPLMSESASISAGIVVAHQKEPFHEVLRAARESEKAAKSLAGKAAVEITILKHSGERLRLCAPWVWGGRGMPGIAELLGRWASAFGSGFEVAAATAVVSPRIVRAFALEGGELLDAAARSVSAIDGETSSAVQAAEDVSVWMLRRHASNIADGKDLSEEALTELTERLGRPTLEFGKAARGETPGESIKKLLEVALFLARHRGGIRGRVRD